MKAHSNPTPSLHLNVLPMPCSCIIKSMSILPWKKWYIWSNSFLGSYSRQNSPNSEMYVPPGFRGHNSPLICCWFFLNFKSLNLVESIYLVELGAWFSMGSACSGSWIESRAHLEHRSWPFSWSGIVARGDGDRNVPRLPGWKTGPGNDLFWGMFSLVHPKGVYVVCKITPLFTKF